MRWCKVLINNSVLTRVVGCESHETITTAVVNTLLLILHFTHFSYTTIDTDTFTPYHTFAKHNKEHYGTGVMSLTADKHAAMITDINFRVVFSRQPLLQEWSSSKTDSVARWCGGLLSAVHCSYNRGNFCDFAIDVLQLNPVLNPITFLILSDGYTTLFKSPVQLTRHYREVLPMS